MLFCISQFFSLKIHRRLLHDDAFGVDEALNETAYGKALAVRGIHYLTFGSTKQSTPTMAAQERLIQLKKLLPNWVFFSDASKYTFDVWQKTYTHIVSYLMFFAFTLIKLHFNNAKHNHYRAPKVTHTK